VTLGALIASASLLALLGVLSIWEVMSSEVLTKSLSSIGVIAFSSFVIVMICLEKEKYEFTHKKMSGWTIFFLIMLAYTFLGSLFR
jgi:hypothetical protein